MPQALGLVHSTTKKEWGEGEEEEERERREGEREKGGRERGGNCIPH